MENTNSYTHVQFDTNIVRWLVEQMTNDSNFPCIPSVRIMTQNWLILLRISFFYCYKGSFVIELYHRHAPRSCYNIAALAQSVSLSTQFNLKHLAFNILSEMSAVLKYLMQSMLGLFSYINNHDRVITTELSFTGSSKTSWYKVAILPEQGEGKYTIFGERTAEEPRCL